MLLSLILLNTRNPGGFILWCGIGFAAGIYLFFRGFYLLQRRRLVLDTPLSRVRSAAMGMVEISGLAVGPYTMIAPITARPCYYYRTVAWEWKRQGKNNQWVKVAGECMHLPFFLDDNTGRVLVDPRGAELDLHRDFREEFNTSFFSRDETPANVNSFLARHGVATSNRIKIEECCIKPKNALFILGTLGDNDGIEVKAEAVSDPDALNQVSARRFSLSSVLPVSRFSLSGGSSLSFFPTATSSDVSSSNSFDNDLNTFAAGTLASQRIAATPQGASLSPARRRLDSQTPYNSKESLMLCEGRALRILWRGRRREWAAPLCGWPRTRRLQAQSSSAQRMRHNFLLARICPRLRRILRTLA